MTGPGPIERRLRSRLIFRLTGQWPAAVVRERLVAERRDMTAPTFSAARIAFEAPGMVGEILTVWDNQVWPEGWEDDETHPPCDGREYDPERFPEAKAVLADRFGVNRVPDLRGCYATA